MVMVFLGMNSTQIAKLAGVSRSTVSKVLHNYKGIPEETRQKVLKVIKEYDYKPNTMSQALRGISPKVIALYFYERMNDPDAYRHDLGLINYNLSMLNAITMEAKKVGYSVVYELIFSYEGEKKIINMINEAFDSRKISSAVFVGLDSDANFIAEVARPDRHIIVLDKEEDTTTGVRCLFSSDFRSAERACEHLYGNGFTRIMHISGETTKLSGFDRRRGYMSFMHKLKAEQQLECEPLILGNKFGFEMGYAVGLQFIEERLYERYNGILCGCDMIAIGFFKRLQEMRPDLIDQLGIIGFDNELVDQYVTPSLSTMSPNYRSFAHMIFDLEQNYEEFKGGMTLKLDHVLIERDSSKPSEQRTTSRIARQLTINADEVASQVDGAHTELKNEKIAEAAKAELAV